MQNTNVPFFGRHNRWCVHWREDQLLTYLQASISHTHDHTVKPRRKTIYPCYLMFQGVKRMDSSLLQKKKWNKNKSFWLTRIWQSWCRLTTGGRRKSPHTSTLSKLFRWEMSPLYTISYIGAYGRHLACNWHPCKGWSQCMHGDPVRAWRSN